MGLFGKKKETLEELEDRKEYLTIKEEVLSHEASAAEKEAIIKELKRKYGSDWRSVLGLKGKLDLQTLRSFLGGMKRGLKGMGSATYNSNLSPLPGRNLRR